jgi:HlyD family secretion protein
MVLSLSANTTVANGSRLFSGATLYDCWFDGMQVATNIDETDKKINGQSASFTVDAFPERPFQGTISQVRLSPQVVQNVVTYPVLIDVPNPELLLKPGMTANVSVPIQTATGVLKILNAALRFRPSPSDLETEPSGDTERRGAVLYMMGAEGKLRAIPVKTSITDGNYTAVESTVLKEGDSIVVGLMTARAMDSTGGFASQPRMRAEHNNRKHDDRLCH